MEAQEVRKFLADRILWLGQSGLLITTVGGKTIYIDPSTLPADPLPADYIFLTHSHGDHYNPRALGKIRVAGTQVVAPRDMVAVATRVMGVGEEAVIGELTVKTFPAYNRRGFPHPRSKDWVGYLLSFDGLRIYHCGDTDSGAELVGMKPDIAFLPIAGFATFSLQAGVEAARAYPGESALPKNSAKE